MRAKACRFYRLSPALLVAGGLGGCNLPGINDLRLEAVRPPTLEQRAAVGQEDIAPRMEIGVIVELSTATDLRRLIGANTETFQAIVVRCNGRTDVSNEPPLGPLIADADLWDRQGSLHNASSVLNNDRPARYNYWLPIGLDTVAHNSPPTDNGARWSWSVAHDLRRDPADLCLYLRGSIHYVLSVWRSNTVVIPYAAIRAALR